MEEVLTVVVTIALSISFLEYRFYHIEHEPDRPIKAAVLELDWQIDQIMREADEYEQRATRLLERKRG